MFQLMRLSKQCHAAYIFLWLCSVYVSLVWVHRHDLFACQCAFSGICAWSCLLSCIKYQLVRNRCILLLRLVCDIPSSATTCMQYPFFKYYIRSYYMDFRLILGCLRLLMRYVFSLSTRLIVFIYIYIYIYVCTLPRCNPVTQTEVAPVVKGYI